MSSYELNLYVIITNNLFIDLNTQEYFTSLIIDIFSTFISMKQE